MKDRNKKRLARVILGGVVLSLSALVYTYNPAVALYLFVIIIIALIISCCLSVLGN